MFLKRWIHINLTNQREIWVEDQITFMRYWSKQNGFHFTYSNKFMDDALNFLFDGASVSESEKTKLDSGKFLMYLIATEHINFDEDLHYNGLHWSSQFDESVDKFTSQKRLGELVSLAEKCEAILILGDLPNIEEYKKSFPSKLIFTLDFPTILDEKIQDGKEIEYDAIFTAAHPDSLTKYRAELIKKLSDEGLRIQKSFGLNLEEFRTLASKTDTFLHIPKTENWVWSSPMRVFRAALTNLRFLSIGSKPIGGRISISDDLVDNDLKAIEAKHLLSRPSMRERYDDLVSSEKNVELGVSWKRYVEVLVPDTF
jgi:hypothetical protein